HPSESGFTTDVLALYDWVKARSGDSRVIFWGHSLGTGIATNTARKLQEDRGVQVDAVVLESPYTNIREAAAHVPVTRVRWHRRARGDPRRRGRRGGTPGLRPLELAVKVLSCPLLILHAEDDAVLPPQLGRKVFEAARAAYADKAKVKLVTFPAKLGLGHDSISSNPELPALVK
ncbi:AB12B protein, partial [Casuarius casuarius]|nr:AB12B protein [Casuarius casuarius]